MSFPGSVLLSGEHILQITSDKRFPLGTRGYTRDGRSFRYARNGATALKAGVICQASAAVTSEAVRTGTTEVQANTSRVKVMTTGTGPFTTANAYADGYLYFDTSSTAKGNVSFAQIKSHTTQTATSTGVVVIDFHIGDSLYSPTTNMGTTLASLRVIRNPYDKVVVKPSGIVTGVLVGVPVRPVTANYYFWMQTWGPCPVRFSANATLTGLPVGASTGTSARVDSINSTKPTSAASIASFTQIMYIINQVGSAMVVGASGKFRMVFLKLAA